MEESLPNGYEYFVAVFIDVFNNLFPALQYARQDRIAATRGIKPDGVKQGRFADSVFAGKQRHAT